MRTNRILLFLLIILGCFSFTSCKSNISLLATSTDLGPTPIPIYLKPLTATWRLAEDSQIQQENSSIAIPAIYLNDMATLVSFTLSGFGFEKFTPEIPVLIKDEGGHSSRLLTVIPIGKVGDLSAGIMVFEPRRMGAEELTLEWPFTDGGDSLDKLVATFGGKGSEDQPGRSYFISQDTPVAQDDYLISFSWGVRQNDQKDEESAEISSPEASFNGAIPTSTPAVEQPLAELSNGVAILQEASLIIDDTQKSQIQTFHIQLLNDGNAIVESSGIVTFPNQIIINEYRITPVPPAYP